MKTGYTMKPSSRKDYLRRIHPRYQQASRGEKRRILDEFCAHCGCHRKYAIRLLNGAALGSRPRRARRRRGAHDGPQVISILKAVWEAADYPWSGRRGRPCCRSGCRGSAATSAGAPIWRVPCSALEHFLCCYIPRVTVSSRSREAGEGPALAPLEAAARTGRFLGPTKGVHRGRVAELERLRDTLDPFALSHSIPSKLDRIFPLSAEAMRNQAQRSTVSNGFHRPPQKEKTKKKEKTVILRPYPNS